VLYRVDYTLAVLIAGFLAGVLLSRRTAGIGRASLGRSYYFIIAALLVLRTALFAWSMAGHPASGWNMVGGSDRRSDRLSVRRSFWISDATP